ncbi:MAG: phage holin family protein [Actinomycetes bacterium]
MSSSYPGRHAGAGADPAGGPGGPGATAFEPGAAYQTDAGYEPRAQYESSNQSVGELMSKVASDLSTLIRQEVALAKAELSQEATKTGKAAGMVSGAGLAGYFVLLFLSLALTGALAAVMPFGWAALIVAAIWAIIAAVLFAKGRSTFRQVHPKPERTIETIKETPQALDLRDRPTSPSGTTTTPTTNPTTSASRTGGTHG